MKNEDKVKIVIVEDQEMFSEGLRLIINSTDVFEVEEVFQTPEDLFNHLLNHQCRVILLDLNLNGVDGLQICSKIKQEYPETKVVIVTGYYGNEVMDKAKKAGADGFVTKDMSARLLTDGLDRILSNTHGEFVTINNPEYFMPSPIFRDEFILRYKLTPREVEIMSLILDGKDPEEITKKLFISYSTFKTHRNHIYEKLEVPNVTELVKFAIRNDLISS